MKNLISINMKRPLLTIICLLTFTMAVLAQKPDVKTLENCEKERKSATEQLNKERAAHRATKDSVQKLNAVLKIEIDANKRLTENLKKAENRPQETQNIPGESCQELKDSLIIAKMEKEKKVLQTTIDNLEKSKKVQPELAVPISKIQRVFPFFVTDINVRSTNSKGEHTDYGKVLYNKKVKWLTVQINCAGLVDEPTAITLRIKIYLPDGLIWKYCYINPRDNNTVCLNYSTKDIKTTIYPGDVNSIFINKWESGKNNDFTQRKLNKGKYRVEVWHEEVCLGSTTFEIK